MIGISSVRAANRQKITHNGPEVYNCPPRYTRHSVRPDPRLSLIHSEQYEPGQQRNRLWTGAHLGSCVVATQVYTPEHDDQSVRISMYCRALQCMKLISTPFIRPHGMCLGIGALLFCAVKHFNQHSHDDLLITTDETSDPMQKKKKLT
jgi:hypothetical protein